MKTVLRETQTLCTGYSKAEPKISARRRPLPGGAGWPKFIQLQTQFGEDRCMQFRVIVVTDPQTHPQTGPITIHCTAASAQCNSNKL